MQLTVRANTKKTELIEAQMYNWCSEVLLKLDDRQPATDDHLFKLLHQLLSVMYRCVLDKDVSLLHANHRRLIEQKILRALGDYFVHHERYVQLLLPTNPGPEEVRSPGLNSHMFCKYPFLKELVARSQQI